MTTKTLLMAGAMALATISLASAKSYDIVLSSPLQAGNMTLAPGEYHFKVQGSNVIFTKADSSKQFTAPVKVESTGTKHENTAVESVKQNGTDQLKAIELGGSNTTLEFGE
jgi:hypothetical protein